MAAPKLSFTVRRPTPGSHSESESEPDFRIPALPRHLADSAPGSPLARSVTASPRGSDSSSDEDDEVQDELVKGFDQFGVQRVKRPKKVPQGPLVIPALRNKDWRELARKRRSAGQFVPPSAAAQTGADGSVGGLGTKDTINSGPVLSGLQIKKKKSEAMTVDEPEPSDDTSLEQEVEETEDQKALRAILAGTEDPANGSFIDVIPTPLSETDAYKQDVDDLPDPSTLDDYNRVPVSQFGAALLRGMGWKEGTAASRKPGKGMVEPYLPAARPALLGIGAKEMEKLDNGDPRQASRRPERRYVPVVRRDKEPSDRRERSRSPARQNGSSRRSSRSPRRDERDRTDSDRRRDHERDRDRERERENWDKRDYDRRDSDRRRDRDRDRHRDRSRDGERRRRD